MRVSKILIFFLYVTVLLASHHSPRFDFSYWELTSSRVNSLIIAHNILIFNGAEVAEQRGEMAGF